MIQKEKNLELKKHVAAIHSSNKLSLIQRKIANALLFNAYDDLLIKDEYQIHIRTLCNLIGYDSNDYKTIKKALVNLLSTVIEWNLVDGSKLDAEGIWNASAIIADASIDGPVCTYSYSNKMKKLLYCPELYGRLNMLVQAKFQSSYGLALYENCIRYQNIEQTPWFDILQFRKLMGIEEGKYLIFRDFKRRVLDKAMEEVNKYSPIILNLKFRKQGRQVVALQFAIKHSNENMAGSEHKVVSSLSQRLRQEFGFSTAQVEETLSSYDEAYILEKIAIVEASPTFTSGKIANLAKYLLRALTDDYQPAKSSKGQGGKKTLSPVSISSQRIATEKQLAEYKRYQDQQIMFQLNTESAAKRNKLLKEFEQVLGKSLYHDIYLREGLANILVAEQFCDFIRLKNPDRMTNIKTLDDFLCKKGSDEEQVLITRVG